MRKPLTYKLGGPEMFAAEFARLNEELFNLKDSYQNWLDASSEIDRLASEIDRLAAELADARAEVERLRKYIDGERSRHLEIVVDLGEQVTKLTAEVERLRGMIETIGIYSVDETHEYPDIEAVARAALEVKP